MASRTTIIRYTAGLALLLALFSVHAASPTFVSDKGAVQGFIQDGVVEYRGIPFAAPPIGSLRFEAPQSAIPWTGTLVADHWRSACPQSARFNQTDGSEDEDCLYLNVAYKPNSMRRRPVLVWFYGGAYVGGSANLYPLGYLAANTNAIIVAGNYRVGVLGFLSHPDLDPSVSSSFGLLDQKRILDWVHHNIARLGGDPNNITITGESAGAISVCLHLSSPLNSRMDFAKAIIQSGACLTPLPRSTDLHPYGLEFAQKLGCDGHDLNCLKHQPVSKILAVQNDMTAKEPHSFIPAIGSAFTPDSPSERFKSGSFVRVPVLNGGNQDEYTLYVGYQVAYGQPISRDNLPAAVRSVYNENTEDVLVEYAQDAAFQQLSAPQMLGRLESDFMPPGTLSHCLMLNTARVLSQFTPVYEYEFTDRDGPEQMTPEPFKLGAVHAGELPYFFPHISHNHKIDGPNLNPQSQRLSQAMLQYWGEFMRTGQPAGSRLPHWGSYRPQWFVMELNPSRIERRSADEIHHCSFWQQRYPVYLSQSKDVTH